MNTDVSGGGGAREGRVGDAPAEWLLTALRSIGDAVIAADLGGRVRFMNRVAEELTSWGATEAQGTPLAEVFRIVDDRTDAPGLNPVEEVLRRGHAVGLARGAMLVARGGRKIPIDDSAAPILGEDGGLRGIVLVFREITARRREEALLEGQKRVLELVARGTDLGETLGALCRMIEEQSEGGVACSILLADRDGTRLRLGAAPGLPDGYNRAIDGLAIGPASGSCGTAAHRREPVAVADIASDPLWEGYAAAALEHGLRACWSRPLLSASGRVLGTFAMYYRTPRLPDEADLRLVDIVTRTAAVAIERKRDEEELRDARTRLESALSAGSIATWTWDIREDRVVPDVNLARLFPSAGGDGGPLARYLEQIHPEDRAWVARAIDEAVASGADFDQEYRVLRGDGSTRWVVARGKVERDADGPARSLSGVVVDVTERKRGEERRRRLAARVALQVRTFDTALSNTPDLIYVFNLEGRFTYANAALLAMWGKSWDEARGKNCLELGYEPWHAAMHDREIRQVIETRRPIRGEVPFEGTNGRRIYDYIFAPVLAPDGTVEAIAGSTRDITERREAEEATRRRAVQLQELAGISARLNAAHDVHSVADILTREACGLIGAREASTLVVPPSNRAGSFLSVASPGGGVVGAEAPPEVELARMLEVAPAVQAPIRLDRRGIEADPSWRGIAGRSGGGPSPEGWLAAPLRAGNGRWMGLVQLSGKAGGFSADDEAILVQLSQLAAVAIENAGLYQQLRADALRKDEFLAMLAHELRNPLAAIGNAVKLLSRSTLKEHADWSLDVIARQMKHLSRLIDDLLDVSRITRGKIELRRDVVEASPILESAAATVRTLIEERKHALEIAIDRGALWVDADPTRLEQVVVNLLNNAAKYSENAGEIRLSGRAEGDEVVIAVEDRGVGIAPEALPGMFELFAQGDRSLARSEGGLGIGLTVVKKLVEMHGGKIEARSDGPGRGSEFVIRLPKARPPASPREGPREAPAAPPRRARILVVDDNEDTARGMERLLRLLGHQVATAHDGPGALEAARAHRPEFVLLDIGLPGMTGYEVASRLRQEGTCKDSVIVAVSGYGQDEDRRRSRESGFDHHLTKPLDHDALMALLSAGGGGRD